MSYADATAGKKRDASKKRGASTALDKAETEEEALAKKRNASSALDEATTDEEALAAGQRLADAEREVLELNAADSPPPPPPPESGPDPGSFSPPPSPPQEQATNDGEQGTGDDHEPAIAPAGDGADADPADFGAAFLDALPAPPEHVDTTTDESTSEGDVDIW